MAYEFIQEDLYVGKQIMIDSDRLVFNGRNDAVFSSKNLFLLKTDGEFHMNTSKDTYINTQKIFNHRSKMNSLSTSGEWSLNLENK